MKKWDHPRKSFYIAELRELRPLAKPLCLKVGVTSNVYIEDRLKKLPYYHTVLYKRRDKNEIISAVEHLTKHTFAAYRLNSVRNTKFGPEIKREVFSMEAKDLLLEYVQFLERMELPVKYKVQDESLDELIAAE